MAKLRDSSSTSPAQLNGFVTFYTMLSTTPRGKHVIRVCTSGPCHVSGSPAILSSLRRLLGVELGETTPDGEFTLEGFQLPWHLWGFPGTHDR